MAKIIGIIIDNTSPAIALPLGLKNRPMKPRTNATPLRISPKRVIGGQYIGIATSAKIKLNSPQMLRFLTSGSVIVGWLNVFSSLSCFEGWNSC